MPRKEDRYSYLNEVELEFASGKRIARISDISRGGCYVDSIVKVPVGEPVSLNLANGSGFKMLFTGQIAYVLDGFGFGVEFTNVTEAQREFLNMLITSSSVS